VGGLEAFIVIPLDSTNRFRVGFGFRTCREGRRLLYLIGSIARGIWEANHEWPEVSARQWQGFVRALKAGWRQASGYTSESDEEVEV